MRRRAPLRFWQVVGLPLMVGSARAALEDIEVEIEDAARADGASRWQTWWYVTLPLARRGILAGVMLGSARALGEFGATLMIAGNSRAAPRRSPWRSTTRRRRAATTRRRSWC
jgi:ABC-type molybdate transport system permease subunit